MARKRDEGPEPCTGVWAQQQVSEYARRREGYVLLGSVLEQVLQIAATQYAPLAIVSVRAKTIPSFAEKCLRKCHKYDRPVDQITDLCGGRIIVHTQEQVVRISRFLEEHFEVDWANSEDIGQRLKTSEFGYRSVHYIVTFKPGVFPTRTIPVEVPARLYGGARGMKNPRAEVQVRTLLQHAWADIGHDLLYKGGFEAPDVWKREYARLAAMLETADGVASAVHGEMRRLVSCYGAYMTRPQMEAELELLEFVREHDPGNVGLALRIGGIANAAERWDTAIAALEPHATPEEPLVLRELGLSYCGKGRTRPHGQIYRRGQELLAQSSEDRDVGAPALLALAESWRGVDERRARAAFARAFEALPDDPHALAGHIEYEVAAAGDLSPTTAAVPSVAEAVRTCEARARAGIDVPGAYFTGGLANLLLGRPYEALDSYAKGLQLAGGERRAAVALDSLHRIERAAGSLEGHAWAVRLLQVALASTPRPTKAALTALQALATPDADPLVAPIVMIAGGCDPARAAQFERYRVLVVRGLADFRGTVIGGGTRQGISGFVGEAAEANPDLRALSYLPLPPPGDASLDPRYQELRAIVDTGFTPMGPLQAWTDLVAAGLKPADVRLLGIDGGRVAAAEYRIALALGATVALVEDSGREAARLLPDERWGLSRRLLRLPADWAAVRAFVGQARMPLPRDLREAVARDQHVEFMAARMKELRPDEPALADWGSLAPEYRESSMRQADDIFAKLALVGLEAVATERPGRFTIPAADVELLAEVEHGRWMVERLLGGWRWGPVKDARARVTPYLVPWDQLSDEVREWDRVFVRAIPAALAQHGYEVRQKR